MPHHYRIYGLNVQSSYRLGLMPEQPPAAPDLEVNWTTDRSQTPDLNLKWQQVITDELRHRPAVRLWRAVEGEGQFTRFRYKTEAGHIDYLLDPTGRKLWIVHSEAEPDTDLQSFFVGPVLGCVLRIRGITCLHASVVKIDDQAVAIAGKKKAGKSTAAAGLSLLGLPILSDDMAVLTPEADFFVAHPGYPQVRLWPRSMQALFPESDSQRRVYTGRDKRYFQLAVDGADARTFWPTSVPLAAIYVLKETGNGHGAPLVEPIAPTERLMTLVANTFGSYVVTDELRRQEFTLLARLANAVPVRRLMVTRDFADLPAQSRAILEDVRGRRSALV